MNFLLQFRQQGILAAGTESQHDIKVHRFVDHVDIETVHVVGTFRFIDDLPDRISGLDDLW